MAKLLPLNVSQFTSILANWKFLQKCISVKQSQLIYISNNKLTWLSLVVSFMASFVLSFFPLDVLDGIWDLIESVSEGCLTYSYKIPFLLSFILLTAVFTLQAQKLVKIIL